MPLRLSMPAAAATLLTLALPAQAALTSFLDTTVDPSGYAAFSLLSDATVGLTITPLASGGNPGAALALDFANGGAPVNLSSWVGFIRTGFSWNPGVDGALASVAFTNDRYIDGGDDFINLNLTAFSRALLVQDGQYYLSALLDPGQVRKAWYTSSAAALTAGDFIGFDPLTGLTNAGLNLDFSASGSAIGFGFLNRFQIDTDVNDYSLNARFAYDNIGFTMNLQGVPEPAVPALLAAAFGALAWTRRRSAGQA